MAINDESLFSDGDETSASGILSLSSEHEGHLLPVSSWRKGLCPKRANMVADKERRACHLSDNERQHSPDTMATQGILLNRAHDKSGP